MRGAAPTPSADAGGFWACEVASPQATKSKKIPKNGALRTASDDRDTTGEQSESFLWAGDIGVAVA
jgi:hypothetical protein